MSTTYRARGGETFDSISRIVYGSPFGASAIRRANPGVIDPLREGATVTVPTVPGLNPQNSTSNDPDEVGILVGGKRFRAWQSVTVARSTDSIDTITLAAPQTPGAREHFRPFSFQEITVTVGGDPLFSGTVVDIDPALSNDGALLSLTAYSTPGVLEDCTPSAAAFPLQFKDLDLYQIAEQLCEPFGIQVKRDTAPQQVGAQFNAPISVGDAFGGEGVALDPGKSILSFLMELAQQRDIVLTNTERGELLLSKPATVGIPVAKLSSGTPPLLSVTPSFNPRKWFSHLTSIGPATMEGDGSAYTAKNKHADGVIRPYVSLASDATDGTARQSAETKLGHMIEDAAAYSISVSTWRSPSGDLWKAGDTLSLEAPDAMVYNPYNFIIRSVEFLRASDSGAATAELVLNIPRTAEGLPWDL